MNPSVILQLISQLAAQVFQLQAENEELRKRKGKA